MKRLWVLNETSSLPRALTNLQDVSARFLVSFFYFQSEESSTQLDKSLGELFSDLKCFTGDLEIEKYFSSLRSCAIKFFKPGVLDPHVESLTTLLRVSHSRAQFFKFDVLGLDAGSEIIVSSKSPLVSSLKILWAEPVIEDVLVLKGSEIAEFLGRSRVPPNRIDHSSEQNFSHTDLGLEFSAAELAAIKNYVRKRGAKLTRTEWEVLAQTWSEHCKHKIFGAEINGPDVTNGKIDGLFRQFIRNPSLEIIQKDSALGNPRALSVFTDNAGVLALRDENQNPTDLAFCLKMETHNSPSALAPRGGAATGLVGVHRDILGTGRGARPIGNWDVLCFEEPGHNEPRPIDALPADVIRLGVLQGIEEGGNQSGVPTLTGSVFFDPRFAVKPYVFAGSIGLLRKDRVFKNPKPGMKLFCFGGSTGADGLRGAVMSSRDLRTEDFLGSAVQVAQPFVQRRLTDFLMDAAEKNLIDVITDNGAGGLSSSVGELASLTGGAKIDLSNLRLKFQGLLGWEKLLSESQERMTVGTSRPDELLALAKKWDQTWDELGELNSSGLFEVWDNSVQIVRLDLEFLHNGCPRLELHTQWDWQNEKQVLKKERMVKSRPKHPEHNILYLESSFKEMLQSCHLCSREKIAQRFDHEVGGRGLTKIFSGNYQTTPHDGALVEVYESQTPAGISLGHGLAPQFKNIYQNTLHSFDEAIRSALLNGIQLDSAGLLDNYAWPDPIGQDRRLWRLVCSAEALSLCARQFGIPFVSGKDSLKNNSKDFASPETLVVSVGGSAHCLANVPASHFSQANDVVFYLPPFVPTLVDSAWSRVVGSEGNLDHNPWDEFLCAKENRKEKVEELAKLIELRSRKIERIISKGIVKAAKDVSEGGLAATVFEMCLGDRTGFFWEKDHSSSKEFLFSEGLSSFVFCLDPHCIDEFLDVFADQSIRLGVVMRHHEWRWGGSGSVWSLNELDLTYRHLGQEGFWS